MLLYREFIRFVLPDIMCIIIYSQRFGVHYVDIYGGNLTRVPKDSARFLTQLFQDNGFPDTTTDNP